MAERFGHFEGPGRSGDALWPDTSVAGVGPAGVGPGQAAAGFLDQVLVAMGGSGPSSVALLDEHDDIVVTTPAWDLLFGYGAAELVGVPVHRLLSPPTTASPEPADRFAIGWSDWGLVPLWGERRDGSRFPVETVRSPMVVADRRYAVVTARDVTSLPGAGGSGAPELVTWEAALLDERQRIARRLHDQVVPRLFGAGLTLSAASDRISDDEVRQDIAAAVSEFDAAIADLRSVIFDLSPPPRVTPLRDRVVALCTAECDLRNITSNVQFRGAIDAVVAPQADALLAVLHEALANVSRRGDISTVDVAVEVDGDLALRVEGHGFVKPDEPSGDGRGAGNALVEQAHEVGAVCGVYTGVASSRFDWRVPRG